MPRITPEITENPLILVNGIVLLALTVLTAVFISLYASNVYKGNKKKAVLFFTVIAALTALSLFCFFGCAATTVKGIIDRDVFSPEYQLATHQLMLCTGGFGAQPMTMDDFEHRLLVGCINKARTEYMEEGKPTEDINELLIKAIEAPTKKEKRKADREGR